MKQSIAPGGFHSTSPPPHPSPYNHPCSLETYMKTLTEAKEMCLGESVCQTATCDPYINLVGLVSIF